MTSIFGARERRRMISSSKKSIIQKWFQWKASVQKLGLTSDPFFEVDRCKTFPVITSESFFKLVQYKTFPINNSAPIVELDRHKSFPINISDPFFKLDRHKKLPHYPHVGSFL